MGLDVERVLDEGECMERACAPGVAAHDNPGVRLGALLGVAASSGIDKLTLIVSSGIYDLGAWLEQLIAESTGKGGKGIIPIDREPVGEPAVYGADRLFVYLRLQTAPDGAQDAAVQGLRAAGKPVVRIDVASPYAVAQELMRWEIATAVAAALLAVNPFDQPDVEGSKAKARDLAAAYEHSGSLPAEAPFFESDAVRLFASEAGREALERAALEPRSLESYLRAHLSQLAEGSYFALLAYLPMTSAHEQVLGDIRRRVRDARRVATCLGFGPRFLHSTGQAYKAGPNTGVFLQITYDDTRDVRVPGESYGFSVVKAVQARGDFEVLASRGRRVLRVHLGPDLGSGLETLKRAFDAVLRAKAFAAEEQP